MQWKSKRGAPKSPFSVAFGCSVADSGGPRLSGDRTSAISRLDGIRWDVDWTAYSQALPRASSEADFPVSDESRLQPANAKHENDDEIQLVEIGQELRSKIVAMTYKLFPGPIRIETDIDPEFPEDKRFVVEVEARGEFREIIERELRWHDKLWELVGKPDGLRFGICIFPK